MKISTNDEELPSEIAIFMIIEPSQFRHIARRKIANQASWNIHEDIEYLQLQVEEKIHYLLLVEIIPSELVKDFHIRERMHCGVYGSKGDSLFGEVWQNEKAKFISADSAQRIISKLRDNHL